MSRSFLSSAAQTQAGSRNSRVRHQQVPGKRASMENLPRKAGCRRVVRCHAKGGARHRQRKGPPLVAAGRQERYAFPRSILWAVKKNESPFIDHHGKESLNFQLFLCIPFLILTGVFCVVMVLALTG